MLEPYAEVIGDPVAHSLSPAIHQYWLRQLGMPGSYRAVRCTIRELSDYLAARRIDPAWRGCNVTMPLKAEAAKLADRAASALAGSGATNCIVARGGELTAFNTDVVGVSTAIAGLGGSGKKAVVIGRGGAAKAAIMALTGRFDELWGINSTAWKGLTPFHLAEEKIAGASLVINATPLGMTGSPPMPPVILRALATMAPAATAFDMVYEPLETEFLAKARAEGRYAIDGLTMLIGQARRAFELFFGVAPPPGDDDLRTALLQAD